MKKTVKITYEYDDGSVDVEVFPPSSRRPLPEQVFLDNVKTMIRNNFIDNPNFSNGHYFKQDTLKSEIIGSIQSSGRFVLERIDELSHLIIPNY